MAGKRRQKTGVGDVRGLGTWVYKRRRDSNLSVRQDNRLRSPRVFLPEWFVRQVADDVRSHNSSLTNRLPELLLLGPVYDIAGGKYRRVAENLELGGDVDKLPLRDDFCAKG